MMLLKCFESDFIQNMSQAPSKCLKQRIKVDNLDTHHSIWKILLVLGANEYLERLEGKIRKCLFFYVKIFKDNSVIWTKAIRYFIRFDLSYKLNVTASLGLVLLFQLCINSIFYLCLDLVYLPLNFNSINLFKNITAW